jgi:hypothetical protein
MKSAKKGSDPNGIRGNQIISREIHVCLEFWCYGSEPNGVLRVRALL